MIEYELDADSVPPVRFGISPLSEVGQSLKLFRAAGRSPLHAARLRRSLARLPVRDRDVLGTLVSARLWTPDFLHPIPSPDSLGFDAELDAVTPAAVVADLPLLYPDGDLPEPLRGPVDDVRERVVGALHVYWTTCFEPFWGRSDTSCMPTPGTEASGSRRSDWPPRWGNSPVRCPWRDAGWSSSWAPAGS